MHHAFCSLFSYTHQQMHLYRGSAKKSVCTFQEMLSMYYFSKFNWIAVAMCSRTFPHTWLVFIFYYQYKLSITILIQIFSFLTMCICFFGNFCVYTYNLRNLKFTLKHLKRSYMFRSSSGSTHCSWLKLSCDQNM